MLQLSKRTAVGSAHGKLILLGEHAVVYGMPAIALPFPNFKVIAAVEEISDDLMVSCDYFDGPLDQVPYKLQGIAASIYGTLKLLNKPPSGLWIRLQSSIPIGRGFGSSAAIATAVVRSLFAFFGEKVNQKSLMSLVQIAERFAHGNPSGIDMTAVSSDYPIWYQKGEKLEKVEMVRPLFLVVADTGRIGDTHKAVASVRNKYKHNPDETKKSLKQLGSFSIDARQALATGNMPLLGKLLDSAQMELAKLGVSDSKINSLVNAARKEGAFGAKLTGGGQGGCILALAQNINHARNITSALMKAGAGNAWYFKYI